MAFELAVLTDKRRRAVWMRAFRIWQRRPHEVAPITNVQRVCASCGTKYQGNFCPRCGQSARVGRFSFKTAFLLFLDIWGIGNRGMFRSIRDLMLRPGYMIRDYLIGYQSAYFPPFKMFFLLTTFSLLLSHGIDFSMEDPQKDEKSEQSDLTKSVGNEVADSVLAAVGEGASAMKTAVADAMKTAAEEAVATKNAVAGDSVGVKSDSAKDIPGVKPSDVKDIPGVKPSDAKDIPGVKPSDVNDMPGVKPGDMNDMAGVKPGNVKKYYKFESNNGTIRVSDEELNQTIQSIQRIPKYIMGFNDKYPALFGFLMLVLISAPLYLFLRHSPAIPDLRYSEHLVALVYTSNMYTLYMMLATILPFGLLSELVKTWGLVMIFVSLHQFSGFSKRRLLLFIALTFLIALAAVIAIVALVACFSGFVYMF